MLLIPSRPPKFEKVIFPLPFGPLSCILITAIGITPFCLVFLQNPIIQERACNSYGYFVFLKCLTFVLYFSLFPN